MRQFQVIPIRISLKHNKYAKSREIVSEDQLTTPAVDLIAAGAIKEVFKDSTEEVPAENQVDLSLKVVEDGDLVDEEVENDFEAIQNGLDAIEEEVPAETNDDTAKITSKDIIADLKNKNKK